jgi:hypothetical protein
MIWRIRHRLVGRAAGVLLVAAAVACALVPAASAHDTYVDRSDGSDASNNCHSKADPCQTISQALVETGSGDTVFVGGDPIVYNEALSLLDGKSVKQKDFSKKAAIDTSGNATVDANADPDPALWVKGKAGTVRGLTFRSNNLPIQIDAAVKLDHITVDESAAIDEDVYVHSSGGKVQVLHSYFTDPTTSNEQDGVAVFFGSQGKVVVKGNGFDGFASAIAFDSDEAELTAKGNVIKGTHEAGTYHGHGMQVNGGPATIVGNTIKGSTGTDTNGLFFNSGHNTIKRNIISGFHRAAFFLNAAGSTHFDGNVFPTTIGNYGIVITDSGKTTVTNTTIWGPGVEISEYASVVKLDSSIIGDAGIGTVSGTGSCSITNSRGPANSTAVHGCGDFQTSKSPKFKSDDYHLKSGSPMIDKGNPDKPAGGARDIDGDKRAIACGHGKARRDIGADEFRC